MKIGTKTFYQRAVQHAAELIVHRLDEALDLEPLAREAALSPFHFDRVFRGMLGETPLELHRRLRMERAAWTLLSWNRSVTAIAFDAGYETHETFTRAFRTRYGCSPSDYRKGRPTGGPDCATPLQTGIATRSGIHFLPKLSGPLTFNFLNGDYPYERRDHDTP